jgi:hypothetical protein
MRLVSLLREWRTLIVLGLFGSVLVSCLADLLPPLPGPTMCPLQRKRITRAYTSIVMWLAALRG